MMRKWFVIIPLVLALLLVCGAIGTTLLIALRGFSLSNINLPTFGEMRFSAETGEQKKFEVKTPAALDITNFSGFVHVQGGETSAIEVTVKKKANGISQQAAQDNLERVKVTMSQTGNTVEIDSELEPNTMNWSGSVELTIAVPKETTVNIRSETGDISVQGTKGNATLKTSFGTARAENIQGALTVDTQSGRVDARGIIAGDADVDVRSQFGEIDMEDVTGAKVTVQSNNGALTLNNVVSSAVLDANSDFGAIRLDQGSADELLIKTRNGDVTLSSIEVDGKVTASSDFGGLRLTGVSASAYDLRSLNGQINLDGASGPVKAHSDFGAVEVKNGRDAVLDLKSNNGSITYEGSLGSGAQALHSQFGAVTLRLPAKTSMDFDFETDFGKISSAFEITIQGALDEKHWKGKINGGGDLVTVTTKNGNIALEISQ